MPVLNKTKIPLELEPEICKLYQEGVPRKVLAIKYGCSDGNIYNICKRNGVVKEKPKSQKQLDNEIKCNDNYFNTIDTPDKAYFLGFIIADGHVSKNKDIKIRLNINDIEILKKFNRYLESEYKIQTTREFDKRTDKYYELCSVIIYRAKLVNSLIKLGVTNQKSLHIDLPKIPENLIKFMIRGIFDGDGGWYINEKGSGIFKITSSTKKILEEIQEILIEKCNVNKTIICFDTGCWKLQYGGNGNIRKLYNYLYDDLHDLFLTRKFEYITKHLNIHGY